MQMSSRDGYILDYTYLIRKSKYILIKFLLFEKIKFLPRDCGAGTVLSPSTWC